MVAGTGIVFLQPLRPFLSVAEDLSSTYKVDLIPGFVMLVVAYTIHFWRRRLEVVTATRREAWEAEEAERAGAELKQLVATLQAFGNAANGSTLSGELARLLQPFLRNRRCWVATSTSDGWYWLLEPFDKSDAWPLMNLARSFADPYRGGGTTTERRYPVPCGPGVRCPASSVWTSLNR